MNRKNIIFVDLIVVLLFAAQNKIVSQSLISPASGFSDNIQWAIGEPITGGRFVSGFIVTQGLPFLDTEEITSVEDLFFDDISFSIFPNPAANFLYIRSSLNGECVVKGQIYDVSGKKKKDINIEPGINSVDISDIDNGFYLLILVSDNIKLKTLKFTRLSR